MKNLILFSSLLAMLLLTACSSDDPVSDNPADGDYSTHYMTVNIMMADDDTSRAGDVVEGFEYGSKAENKVDNIRFYFYTENGEAAKVKPTTTGYQNYYDWPHDSISQSWESSSTAGNVESHIAAKIVINTPAGDKLPRKVVAVINPTNKVTDSQIQKLSALRSISNDYTTAELTKSGSFVMTNSVYGDGTPLREVCAVDIEDNHICTSMAAAQSNPVTVYVERTVAKVKVSAPTYVNQTIALVKKKAQETDQDENIMAGPQQVYLKVLGWALTAETNKGYLIKKIDTTWITNWWNGTGTQHRSFWATNSDVATNEYLVSYDGITTGFGEDSYLYTNENAAPASTGSDTQDLEHTKFIIKGVLCDQSGNALTLVRHMGSLFVDNSSDTEADNLPNLKSSILTYLQSDENNTYWTANTSGTGRRTMSPADIAIERNATDAKEDSKNNCYVHAKLTDAAKALKWYATADETDTQTVDATTIDGLLANRTKIGEALVWRNGQTYYYKEIVHKNADGSTLPTYGVVRNHVYKANITGITGLGTPVYDPKEIIYPEKPEEDDHYIAAKIEILSWRTISYDYTLDW